MKHIDDDMLILKNGGRWDFWVAQVEIIERFVKATRSELTQIKIAAQSPVELGTKAPAAAGKAILWDPTRGGMRMPHLHYAGEIFLLNEAQWASFSKSAIKALTEKLGKAQKVGFEDVMQVSEALSQIG
jgi:hypothetical protein